MPLTEYEPLTESEIEQVTYYAAEVIRPRNPDAATLLQRLIRDHAAGRAKCADYRDKLATLRAELVIRWAL